MNVVTTATTYCNEPRTKAGLLVSLNPLCAADDHNRDALIHHDDGDGVHIMVQVGERQIYLNVFADASFCVAFAGDQGENDLVDVARVGTDGVIVTGVCWE